TEAPNTSSASAMVSMLGAVIRQIRLTHIISPAATITLRQPRRPVSTPVTGMDAREPAPRHSSNKPSVASFTARRSLAKGTSGAQVDIPNPATRNAARVDICSAKPGVGWEAGVTTDITFTTRKRTAPEKVCGTITSGQFSDQGLKCKKTFR